MILAVVVLVEATSRQWWLCGYIDRRETDRLVGDTCLLIYCVNFRLRGWVGGWFGGWGVMCEYFRR